MAENQAKTALQNYEMPFLLIMNVFVGCEIPFLYLIIENKKRTVFLFLFYNFCPQLEQKLAPPVLVPQFGQKLGFAPPLEAEAPPVKPP